MNLLFDFRPIVINPKLAAQIGLNEAIILQQLKYWIMETNSGVEHEGLKWIYNTHQAWVEQFPFWSEDTIKRGLLSLKAKGAIRIEQLNKAKHDRTNFYTIIFESACLIEEGNLHSSIGARSADLHTENTAEKKSSRHQQADDIPYDQIFDAYERVLPGKPRVRIRDDARRGAVRSLWRKDKKYQSVEFWERYFGVVRQSTFLMGQRTFAFDWLMKPANFKKVAEGNYDNA